MCIIQGKTSSKHNGLTYQHKRNKKTEYRLSSNSGNKRKIYQNKWHLTHEKLPIEKN